MHGCGMSHPLRFRHRISHSSGAECNNRYHEHVGKEECAVVDTYWQTETGSIIITPLPGATQTKPGSATLPFFGIDPVLLEPTTGKEIDIHQKSAEGVLAIRQPWPSMARTVYGDHERYLDTYLRPCKFFGDFVFGVL